MVEHFVGNVKCYESKSFLIYLIMCEEYESTIVQYASSIEFLTIYPCNGMMFTAYVHTLIQESVNYQCCMCK